MPSKKFIRSITDIPEIEKWLINISINQTAVRNHGTGIVKGIRHELYRKFELDLFMTALTAQSAQVYQQYLDELTRKISGRPGRDGDNRATDSKIAWGAARKCINLLARSIVYNAFIWKDFRISISDFGRNSMVERLEIPLDSYAVRGIKADCKEYKIIMPNKEVFKNFTILHLTAHDSKILQEYAQSAAEAQNTCRLNLDIIYWRKNKKRGTEDE